MTKIIIAPIGGVNENALIGIDEFKADDIYLIIPNEETEYKDLEKAIMEKDVKVNPIVIKDDIWEGTFKAVSKIVSAFGTKETYVNISASDLNEGCAATCAAFVNGIKAFRVDNNKVKMLPVMRFAFYKHIPEKKMDILRYLYENSGCCESMDELGQKLKMSLPLVSYHINGTLRSEGLKSMGLIDTAEEKGKVKLSLTSLARLVVEGHVVPEEEN